MYSAEVAANKLLATHFASAISLLGLTGELVDELLIDIAAGKLNVIEVDRSLFAEFQLVIQTCLRGAQSIAIRTLDALHLAAALSSQETEFVSHDKRQRTAAAALGMTVLP